MYLRQSQYLLWLLEKYGFAKANRVSTPKYYSGKLIKTDVAASSVVTISYQSMVGHLLHAARATRPDISYAVGVVSRFNSNPSEAPSLFLKGTIHLSLHYKATGKDILRC